MRVFDYSSNGQQFLVVDKLPQNSPIVWIIIQFFSAGKYRIQQNHYLTDKGYYTQLILEGIASNADLILAKHFVLSVVGVDKVLSEYLTALEESTKAAEVDSIFNRGEIDDTDAYTYDPFEEELYVPF